MWQVLLGIYLVIVLLSVVLLWSSLVVAKNADRKTTGSTHSKTELILYDESNSIGKHGVRLPTLNEFSEK